MSTAATSTAMEPAAKSDSRRWLHVGLYVLLAAAFVALFNVWFERQIRFSHKQMSDWGHAYFVPLISVYLVWLRRDRLAKLAPRVDWMGMGLVLAGIAMYVFFMLSVKPLHLGMGVGIILSLWGLVWLFFGRQIAIAVALPVSYLIFAVKLPDGPMYAVTSKLQVFASSGASGLLRFLGALMGFDVVRDGIILNIIDGAGKTHPLNVAEACSGMRMVIAFLALSVAVALISCRHMWQRVVLVMTAVPVAVALNIVRVAVLGLLTLVNPALASGQAHMVIGTALLIPGLGLFMGIVWVLNRVVVDDAPQASSGGGAGADFFALRVPVMPYVASLVLLLAAGGAVFGATKAFKVYVNKVAVYPQSGLVLGSIPADTANWERLPGSFDRIEEQDVVEVLGTENYVSRLLVERNPPAHRPAHVVDFHASYYTGTIDPVPHVPERCFVGGGMKSMKRTVVVPVPLDPSRWWVDEESSKALSREIRFTRTSGGFNGERGILRVRLPFNASEIRMTVGEFYDPRVEKTLFAGYFFIANGGTVAGADGVRELAYKREDVYAYYAKVQFTSGTVGSAEELAEVAASILNDNFGDIMVCLPDWTDVLSGRWPAPPGYGPGGR